MPTNPTRTLFAFVTLLVIAGTDAARGQILDTEIVASSNAGVYFVCPGGDGGKLSAVGLSITVTLTYGSLPVPGAPASDFWLSTCGPTLSLCAVESLFDPGQTNANGTIVLDGQLAVSGCNNTGLRVSYQGWTPPQPCLPIQVRSADLKSSGAGACGGDQVCPDGVVSLADFSAFGTHYPTALNPGATYLACVDYASPFGSPIGLADFAKFATHFAPGHHCV